MAQTINTRQLMLESATFRSTITEAAINIPTISEFIKLESTGILSPASIVLNAVAYNTTNPAYSWHYKSNDLTVTDWTLIAGANTSTLTITNTNYNIYLGTGTEVSFRVTCKDSISVDVRPSTATQVITYIDESKSIPFVTSTSENTVIICDDAGTPLSLVNTGTKLQVSLSGTTLFYAVSGPNTWNIGTPTQSPTNSVVLGPGAATDSNKSYTYADITGLTADEVVVTFPIIVRNSQGIPRNTINATQKFVKNKAGSSGIYIALTNDSHGVPANSDGGSPVLTGSGTDIYAYEGATQLTYDGVGTAAGTWTVTRSNVIGVTSTGTITDQGIFARIPALTSITNTTGSITYTVTGKTLSNKPFTTSKIQTFSRNDKGVSAGWYGVEISTPVVYKDASAYNQSGTTSPISISGYKYVGDTKALYGWLKITPYIGVTAGTPGYMYRQYSETPDPGSTAEYYVVSLRDDTNSLFDQARIDAAAELDKEEIRVVLKGNSATRFSIDNAASTFAKNKAGVISPLAGITLTTSASNFTSITYQWQKNGVNISGATSSSYIVPISDYTSVNTNTYRCNATGTINGVAGQTLNDSITIPRLDDGTNAPTVVLSNENVTFPSPVTGYAGILFTGGDCAVTAYLGTTQLTYAATGANTFSVAQSSTGATLALGTSAAFTYTVPAPTAMSTDTAYTDVVITIRDAAGVALAGTITRRISYSLSRKGAPGADSTVPGPSGTKSITINAFQWSNTGAGTFSQAFTYTWSTGAVSAYPSNWLSSASASPGTGYTLYQLNLVITATATATDTVTNWSAATINTIGYRQDGTIGPQGGSSRTAYVVNTSSTVPGAVTAVNTGNGDNPPTSAAGTWSFAATSTLTPGQYMYQVDGIYNPNVVPPSITWGNPYLSNLKVGSLSALSADLGVVEISTTGSLASTGKAYGGVTAGFFLGYDSAAYKFDIGNSTKYLRWTGTDLSFTGDLTGAAGTFSGNLNISGIAVVSGTTSAGSWGNTNLRCGGLSAENNPISTATYGIIAAGSNRGIVGIADGPSVGNWGVYGQAYSSTNSVGVYGTASGTNSKGVYAEGDAFGVHGRSTANTGVGVYAEVTSTALNSSPIAVRATSPYMAIEASTSGNVSTTVYAQNIYPVGTTNSLSRLAYGSYSFYGDIGVLHNIGEIRSNGNVIGGYSDIRLKTDIKPITSALSKVAKLTGFTYNPNNLAKSFGITDEPSVGLSAQDLQSVLPEAVKMAPFDIAENGTSKSGDNYKTIQYERVVPLLVEAIKELQQEVSYLKQQIRSNNAAI